MKNNQITIQKTNNNSILKFVSTQILTQGGSYEFNTIDEAKNAPLAQQLFHLPFVKKVYITANFIAIQRYNIIDWEDVEEEVRLQIENYLKANNTVIIEKNITTKKEAIEVYAEATPNPSVMKFGTNKALTQVEVEYKNIDQASKSSPLAQTLFSFPFVKEVFISDNYISITKYDMVEWNEIYATLRTFIKEYLEKKKPIIQKNWKEKTLKLEKEEKTQIPLEGTAAKITEILDEFIKPAVTSDGGNIAFQSYNKQNKTVHVVLQGACSGCPSSKATLKNGIENLLKEMLPNQINEVIAVNG